MQFHKFYSVPYRKLQAKHEHKRMRLDSRRNSLETVTSSWKSRHARRRSGTPPGSRRPPRQQQLFWLFEFFQVSSIRLEPLFCLSVCSCSSGRCSRRSTRGKGRFWLQAASFNMFNTCSTWLRTGEARATRGTRKASGLPLLTRVLSSTELHALPQGKRQRTAPAQ